MARFRLIPRNEKFFADFVSFSEELRAGARLLEEMLAGDEPRWDKAEEVKEIEHRCDNLTHEIIQRLNRSFITPIDREDIYALAKSLDDIMDAIDDSATALRIYQIAHVRFGAREMAHIISASTDQVQMALAAMERHRDGVRERTVEINRLENEADRLHQKALSRLFEEERDPIAVIKWKEILDFLESATDRCEDVANVLEGVVVKHA